MALTAYLGCLALKPPPFEYWAWPTIAMAVLGLLLIVNGTAVGFVDKREAKVAEARSIAERRAELNAKLVTANSDIGTHEHWLMIATSYDDNLRANELAGELATLRAERDTVVAELKALQ